MQKPYRSELLTNEVPLLRERRRLAGSCRSALLGLTAALALLSLIPAADAEGFPGKGNRLLYAEALPHYNLGNRYLAKECPEKAVEKYLDAINIYEFDADVYTNLSVAYRKLGNMQGAEDACRKAVELNDTDWTSWSNLGNLLMLREAFPEACKCFTQSMKCNIPAAEKEHIMSNIDGMKKIMKARGLTIEGRDLAPPAVPQPATAARKMPAATPTTAPRKTPPTNRSNQLAGARDSALDTSAYDQWLGEK